MRVATYYERLNNFEADEALVQMWAESWRAHGWEPEVLSRADAWRGSPEKFGRIVASPELHRGPCPPEYNEACHLRWLAHLLRGGGLMVDYDVLNRGFTPADLRKIILATGEDVPLFMTGAACPCVVYANRRGVQDMVDVILRHADEIDGGAVRVDDLDGELKSVAHDQAVFERFANRFLMLKIPMVVENYQPDDYGWWRNFPLTHFRNDTTPAPRAEFVRENNFLALAPALRAPI